MLLTLCKDRLNENEEESMKALRDFFDGETNAFDGYDSLAKLSGYNKMNEVMNIFAQKIISNLMTSSVSGKEEDKKIVDLSLEVLNQFFQNRYACQLMTQLHVLK